VCVYVYIYIHIYIYIYTHIYVTITHVDKLVTSCWLAYAQISPTGFLSTCLPESVLTFCESLCALCTIHTLNTGDKGIVVQTGTTINKYVKFSSNRFHSRQCENTKKTRIHVRQLLFTNYRSDREYRFCEPVLSCTAGWRNKSRFHISSV